MPCPYAHALGVPGVGVHAPRLLGLARFDTIATVLVAFITSFIIQIYGYFKYSIQFPFQHYFHILFRGMVCTRRNPPLPLWHKHGVLNWPFSEVLNTSHGGVDDILIIWK
jgi:hypothetical protein